MTSDAVVRIVYEASRPIGNSNEPLHRTSTVHLQVGERGRGLPAAGTGGAERDHVANSMVFCWNPVEFCRPLALLDSIAKP
jgi:hypothetical protein